MAPPLQVPIAVLAPRRRIRVPARKSWGRCPTSSRGGSCRTSPTRSRQSCKRGLAGNHRGHIPVNNLGAVHSCQQTSYLSTFLPQPTAPKSCGHALLFDDGLRAKLDQTPERPTWLSPLLSALPPSPLSALPPLVDVHRARLDQTLQRLTRIVDITEADQNRPSPRTVEKALLNRGGGGETAADVDCPGGEDDIGAATTRKRLAFGLGA